MLSGFANENRSQNRFMARTRQMNSNFSYAIGTKEVTPLPDIYKSVRKAPINQVYSNITGTKDVSFQLSDGTTGFINKTAYPFAGQGCSDKKCPTGYRCVWSKWQGQNYWAYHCVPNDWLKADGGFANAIGTTKTLTTTSTSSPSGYPLPHCQGNTASTVCLSCNALQGQNCPIEAGNYEASNQAEYDFLTNSCGCSQLGTRPTSLSPTNVSVKFDGGFANAYGNPVQRTSRPLVYNPYANAIGKTTYIKPTSTTPAPAYTSCGGHSGSTACYACPQFNSTMSSAEGCPIAEGNYSGAWDSDFLLNGCGCSYNPPITTTKPTSLSPTNVSVKFDGGFANAYGSCGGDALLGL
jgi:hypothetical protein